MEKPNLKKFLETLTPAVAKILLKNYAKIDLKSKTKESPADLITEADLEANDYIIRRIKKEFPDHGIISEESPNERPNAEYVWIIDPLDDSSSFLLKIPLWGFMIGVLKEKAMQAGVICNPIFKETVIAEKNRGAFKNGKKINCSSQKSFAFSRGCTSARFPKSKKAFFKHFLEATGEQEFWANSFGTLAINAVYAADGRRDWLLSTGTKLHDYAVPSLVLQEAGCRVTNFKGENWRPGDEDFVAANPKLHKELMKILKGVGSTSQIR